MSESMLFGFSLGDGWLSKTNQRNHDSYYYQIGFSGDLESINGNVIPDLKSLYGDIGKASIRTELMVSPKYGISGTTTQFVANTKVAKRFIELGMIPGKKVEIPYVIPKWIMNGSKQIRIDFLSGFYSAEGFTPSFQNDKKTLKTLGFRFFKRKSDEDSKNFIVSQWSNLLDSLDIEYSYVETKKRTVEDNFVCTFTFSNSHEQVIHQLSLLNLKYCSEKNRKRERALSYYLVKNEAIVRMRNAQKDSLLVPHKNAKEIAEKFSIDRNLVYKWRKKPTRSILPRGFMTYDEYCLSL